MDQVKKKWLIVQPLNANKGNFLLNFFDGLSFSSAVSSHICSAPKRSYWPETIGHLKMENISMNQRHEKILNILG